MRCEYSAIYSDTQGKFYTLHILQLLLDLCCILASFTSLLGLSEPWLPHFTLRELEKLQEGWKIHSITCSVPNGEHTQTTPAQ